ncbi:trans-L-3-hydroxyproline dehydratase-like isoform X1 [Gigantopelta aegis]|uniref:trans-L-3-hydroxyproline dehydratase-like isoform X1 n=1 Tax=Gigantopelta aegis TaxID=1735272 RepID=UPI001B888D76|nr:trans-L-3-hydroxyproline dehydratase-like isoform X1 [Gigantopelta aegis]XP_041378374.1 trans-L-3-hydroxyproline dehydratase-like isoform X1 [Gigantopelta aegis]
MSRENSTATTDDLHDDVTIRTTEMHTSGEPVRIIESGFPHPVGSTVLEQLDYTRQHLDDYRRLLMLEPRGHFDMFGALLVKPKIAEADIGVIFLHNNGYSNMCGHAVIALARYAVDKGLVTSRTCPETKLAIECPCGLVRAFVQFDGEKTGSVRFRSVPAFVLEADVVVDVEGFGKVKVDISYGGVFYALVSAKTLALNLNTACARDVAYAADAVSAAVKSQVEISHPESSGLNYLMGTIVTDGQDRFSEDATTNICIFADRQVDRAPCGSGVTARVALQHHKALIHLGQVRRFQSGTTGGIFTGKVVEETTCGGYKSVIVEVSGKAFYMGSNVFTWEADDQLGRGFLVR